MPQTTTTIQIAFDAPSKPKVGAPCNGCGVCCLLEPCPLGVLLSGRRQGACRALRWQADLLQYRCGAMISPRAVLQEALPRVLHPLASCLAWPLGRLAGRWVAAGMGCDCEVQIVPGEDDAGRTLIIGP